MGYFQLGAFLVSVLGLTSAADVYAPLEIKNAQLSPDGFSRSIVSANGTFPAPLIKANVGDRFLINVTDNLSDETMRQSTSIHWHGLFQKQSAQMDGVVEITQCPIVPGHSFLYNFTAPGQSGTYWYHSHLSTQYCDGLAGPLVIYDPEDPLAHLYDVDDESTVITVSDWLHKVANEAHAYGGGAPPVADATLINGKGRYAADPTADLAVIRAQDGKRHRFRLVNIGCDQAFTVSIDSHKLTIIEADGIETEPYEVEALTIFAGQRYSVVVEMDQDIDNYWVRSLPLNTNDTTSGINSAILRYDGAPIAEPQDRGIQQTSLALMDEGLLHPLENAGAPGGHDADGADVVLYLTPSLTADLNWAVNNVSFLPPSAPVLLQILGGNTDANSLLPVGSVYDLPKDKVIEVHITGGFNHPFHLHGHTFDVIQHAGSTTPNYENPVRRDVLTTGTNASSEVIFRFTTDNPGPWFLHCHIDWHLQDGLAVVFAEDTREIADNVKVNSDWEDLCPLYNSLNPDGHFVGP